MAVTVPQTLQRLTHWVKNGVPFCHVRYGDGECRAMFDGLPEDKTNGDGHRYFRDMGERMREGLDWICTQRFDGPVKAIGTHLGASYPVSTNDALRAYLAKLDPCYRVRPEDTSWMVPADFWAVPGEVHDGPELLDLLKSFRQCIKPVVLVGKPEIYNALYCLTAAFLPVPAKDAWLVADRAKTTCRILAARDTVFIWACGYLGKVLSVELFREFPQSSHLDVGHLFDAVFRLPTRDWIAQLDEEQKEVHNRRAKYVKEVLTPYVKGFIP